MIFTSGVFIVFYVLVFAVYWLVPAQRWRNAWLLLASQVFYGWWDWRFLGLMWFCILVCHGAGRLIERGVRRRLVLGIAVGAMLAVLAVFKYFGFFIDSAAALAAAVGAGFSVATMEIILPVGISFFTFQAISYVVDVYRGKIPSESNLLNTGFYISFFPQLVAGPIVRASEFLPQIRSTQRFDPADFTIGVKLFLIGFIYKAVFSDSIAPFVDGVYGNVPGHDGHSLVMATLGFYSQIYFDFCGYSMMAIGVARTFGFHLTRNFNFPYISTSITEFWRRWHISLSSWLRDYLYIPLGGNRGGENVRRRNLMLTMLFGGLWHGASWNFVLWGGLHGLALIIHKRFDEATAGWFSRGLSLMAWTLVAWLLTQLFVLLTWIPFRAQTFAESMHVLRAFGGFVDGGLRADIPYLFVLAPIILDTLVVGLASDRLRAARFIPRLGAVQACVLLGCVAALALLAMPLEVTSFIYFQF